MKKILGIMVLSLLLITTVPSLSSFNSFKDLKKKEPNFVTVTHDLNYFLKIGYKIKLEKTIDSIKVYVLKKEKSYIGCLKKEYYVTAICYEIILKRWANEIDRSK